MEDKNSSLKTMKAHWELGTGNRSGEMEWSNWDPVFQFCSIFVSVGAKLFF